ncbi:isochorismate synthase [Vagococcus vulneris]|uniref:isochorismate synthase n=1 Tax=Vagococcus vulneris TaxID=1977869 RepID=A0A429ZY93_9ENTE|nr:isochorismate synthase [Vagococcus vulneris]RST98918.1 hypothetical protein CBF37_05985 [Vagococcus vulneris]
MEITPVPQELAAYQNESIDYLTWIYDMDFKKTVLDLFQASQSLKIAETWYWETPNRQQSMAGFGAVAQFIGEAAKPQKINDWHKKQKTIVLPDSIELSGRTPSLVGAFPFMLQGHHPNDNMWGEFGDGFFFLPKIQILANKKKKTILFNFSKKDLSVLEKSWSERVSLVQKLSETLCSEESVSSGIIKQIELDIPAWMDLVEKTIKTLNGRTELAKVVTARILEVESRDTLSSGQIMAALREQQPNTYLFSLTKDSQTFIGSTPERLLKATPSNFLTASIAGSTPRGATAAEDQHLGNELLQDLKNRGEHQIVVDRIVTELEQLSGTAIHLDEPTLLKNRDIQHLFLPIEAPRVAQTSFLTAVETLHPTPALGGEPKQLALDFLAAHEPIHRGLYGAPVGWLSLTADCGEFAVGIRSALLDKHKGYLYAGCGIVKESQPTLELAETRVKFQPMLRGMGGK